MIRVLLLFLIICSFNSHATPKGFEDLLELKSGNVKLVLNDNSIRLPAKYNSLQISFDPEKKEEIREFLKESFVQEAEANAISDFLIRENQSSRQCHGNRENCQINSDEIELADLVIIPNLETVRLFVSSSKMASKIESSRNVKNEVDENIIIINHSLSMSAGSQQEEYLNYHSRFTAGLGEGFVTGDFRLMNDKEANSYNRHIYSDEMSFSYLSGQWKSKIGYISSQNNRAWNATSILDASDDVSGIGLWFGTSSDLKFKSRSNQARLYFSIPSSGRLYIYRQDGSSVLERNVESGQNYISYSELPKGISDLTIVVDKGGEELYREKRKVYNIDSDTLFVGSFDTIVSVGILEDLISSDNDSNNFIYSSNKLKDNEFIKGSFVNQATESLKLGLDLLNTKSEHYFKVGSSFKPNSWLVFNGVLGEFYNSSKYNTFSASLGNFRVDWSEFKDNGNSDPKYITLDHYLYGRGSFTEWSVGLFNKVFSGDFYLNYNFRNRYSFDDSNLNYSGTGERHSTDSLNIGYSRNFIGRSTISSNVSYTINSRGLSSQSDDWSINIGVSVPISPSDDFYYNASYRDSTSPYQHHRASYSHRFDSHNDIDVALQLSGSGSLYSDREMSRDDFYGDLTTSLSYSSDKVNGSAVVFADTNSSLSLSGDLNSTSILSQKTLFQTSLAADSYLLVHDIGQDAAEGISESNERVSFAQLKANGDIADRVKLSSDKVAFPISTFKEYEVVVDDSSSDFYNYGERESYGTSKPGSAIKVNVDNRMVRSYISAFVDIEGKAIEDIQCTGSGCVSVEQLKEGIFKLRVSKGYPFRLSSQSDQRCFIPAPDQADRQNLGENFCMPQFELIDGIQVAKMSDGDYYYYIGEFSGIDELQQLRSRLSNIEPESELLSKKIGKRNFVFIKSDDLFAVDNRDIISSLSSYALEEIDNQNYVYK